MQGVRQGAGSDACVGAVVSGLPGLPSTTPVQETIQKDTVCRETRTLSNLIKHLAISCHGMGTQEIGVESAGVGVMYLPVYITEDHPPLSSQCLTRQNVAVCRQHRLLARWPAV